MSDNTNIFRRFNHVLLPSLVVGVMPALFLLMLLGLCSCKNGGSLYATTIDPDAHCYQIDDTYALCTSGSGADWLCFTGQCRVLGNFIEVVTAPHVVPVEKP